MTPVLTAARYEEWLPSANATIALRNNIQLRLGLGSAVGRKTCFSAKLISIALAWRVGSAPALLVLL